MRPSSTSSIDAQTIQSGPDTTASPPSDSRAAAPPLVVDLDGTLTPTDTLIESLIKLIKTQPLAALQLPLWLLRGRAAFKAFIASKVSLSVRDLPLRAPLVEYLRNEKNNGRRLILATASHRSTADAVASHLQLFDQVLATDGERNLKSRAKLEAIRQHVGSEFVYAGDSSADIEIWKAASAAILVNVSSSTRRALGDAIPVELQVESKPAPLRTWLRALRLHQWLKNVLLFVPVLTAFAFTAENLLAAAVAFLAFCCTASATYLVNDLWDLENDRAHPRKRKRPLASGEIPILYGVVTAVCLHVFALTAALSVSPAFTVVLLVYLTVTSLYSWVLKTVVLVNVLTLSLLYTIRIVAGTVVIDVTVTSWLLAFSVFIFFSLALVKRCSELVALHELGRAGAHGRDYRVKDLVVLWPLGVGASLCAVVVLGLFISDEDTQTKYATPELLWLAGFGLIYWLSRLWIKTSRGEMHDDPLVFAARDWNSRVTVAGMIAATVIAHSLAVPFI